MRMNQKIIHGDCLEVMREWGKEQKRQFKLIITSPPYNLQNKAKKWGDAWRNASLQDGYDDHDDAIPPDEYIAWQRDCLAVMWGLLAHDGAIFYNTKWLIKDKRIDLRHEIIDGFAVRQVIIWDRGSGHNHQAAFYTPSFEVIYLIAKDDFKLRTKHIKYRDVWRILPEMDNDHPAPFPVVIPARIIDSVVIGADDFVLDPFCGSGTTLCAAKQAGISAVGIEKSAEYASQAQLRLANTPERML